MKAPQPLPATALSKERVLGLAQYHTARSGPALYLHEIKIFGGEHMEKEMPDIPVEELQKRMDAVTLATGLGTMCLLNKGGRVLRSTYFVEKCPFCCLVQGGSEGNKRCIAHMRKAGQLSMKLGEAYISRCHAGFITFTAPIVSGDVLLGAVSAGPVMIWDWDELTEQELITRTSSLDIPKEALLGATKAVKILGSREAQACADLLYKVITGMMQEGLSTLEQHREINEQQMLLAGIIHDSKSQNQERQRTAAARGYPIQREQELLLKVRVGDRTGAKRILNELLGDVFFRSAGRMEVMKARVLELVVMISRAAVEGGAELDALLGMNYRYISELSTIESFEDMCLWVVRVLDSFLNAVYRSRNVSNSQNIGKAIEFMQKNFVRPITLEEVAGHVHISPFYLSHLFRDEMGITYLEYLTQLRVEHAKKLLRETRRSVNAIAAESGYEDPGYFSKVFKRTTGVTPNQYRRQG